MPIISPKDIENHNQSLQVFKGKVVLLNFWATWCAPCRLEMPALDRLQNHLGESGFKVAALSINRGNTDLIANYYKKLGLSSLDVYMDPNGMAATILDVPVLPTTILIDKNGDELGRSQGAAEWDSQESIAFINRYLMDKITSIQ